MVIIYDDHIWSSHTYGHQMWSLHMIIIYGHHIGSSYRIIIHDHHRWSSYMIIIYDLLLKQEQPKKGYVGLPNCYMESQSDIVDLSTIYFPMNPFWDCSYCSEPPRKIWLTLVIILGDARALLASYYKTSIRLQDKHPTAIRQASDYKTSIQPL